MRFDAVVFPDGIIRKSTAEVCIKQASQAVKATRATVALVCWRGMELTTLCRSELGGGGGGEPDSGRCRICVRLRGEFFFIYVCVVKVDCRDKILGIL